MPCTSSPLKNDILSEDCWEKNELTWVSNELTWVSSPRADPVKKP
jgi:hypothetical protein